MACPSSRRFWTMLFWRRRRRRIFVDACAFQMREQRGSGEGTTQKCVPQKKRAPREARGSKASSLRSPLREGERETTNRPLVGPDL